MPRRLLQIVSSLDAGEATATVATVSQWMVNQGLEVAVLGLRGGGDLEASLSQAGVRVRWIGADSRHVTQLTYQVRRELQRFQPDIVHTWTEQANGIGRLAAVTTGAPRLIASLRSLPRRPKAWSQVLDWTLARRTEAYVANSRTAVQFHLGQGLSSAKLRLIPEGVDLLPTVLETHRTRVRERLGLPPHAKLIGAVGPLIPSKRLKDAIWAVDLLRVFYQDVYLIIIGDGPQRWRWERYARQVQDRRRTLFLGPRHDWLELLRGLDCLCQAGQRESMPLAVLEAMAAGVAVVATDIPGHRELIESDRTGRLVPLGDRGELARELHQLLENRPLVERLTTTARQVVQQRHAVQAMLAGYRQLYFEPLAASTEHRQGLGGARPRIP